MDVKHEYIEKLMLLVQSQGVSAETLLETAGIDFPDNDQDFHLDAAQFSRLYACATQLVGDECFGFFGQGHVPSGTFEALCAYLLPSQTLGQALRRAARFYNWMEHLQHRKASVKEHRAYQLLGGVVQVLFINQSSAASPVFIHQRAIASGLASWHRFLCWLVAAEIPLLEVHLQGRPQLDEARQARIFSVPIRYQQSHNALVFSEHFLDAKVVHDSQSMQSFLRQAPYHLVATSERDGNAESLTNQVKRVMGNDFSTKPPGIDKAAKIMNISARTLRRNLEREGTSFQRIKDECRLQGAIALLAQNTLSIAQIAEHMGFDEASAFHRAFKKWTGLTPGNYRERLLT